MCVVLKFGGSSLSSVEKIKKVAKRIVEITKIEKCVVVVSAMGNATDKFLSLAKNVCANIPNASVQDKLLNLGELKSVYLLTLALLDLGVKTIGLNGNEAGIITYGEHGNSSILKVNSKRLKDELNNFDVIVVAGFCGENEKQEICTLGRGGSDTTAVALAATLCCKCVIFSDVDGVYTIDPRVYKGAKKLNKIMIDDMLELSAFGARVLEGRCVEIAKQKNVSMTLANSANKTQGTEIKNKPFENLAITGATVLNYALLKIKIDLNNFKSLINFLNVYEIKPLACNFIFSENLCEINLSCPQEKLQRLIKNIENMAKNIDFYPNLSMVTVVGSGFCNYFGGLYNVIAKLIESDIKIYYFNLCDRVFNVWVHNESVLNVIELLSKEFNL